MSLSGTKTEENLKAAFAGESQANRRYLYFAQKADIEGYNDVKVGDVLEAYQVEEVARTLEPVVAAKDE